MIRSGARSRGPYRVVGRTTYEERSAAYAVPRQLCKCGCGKATEWDSSRIRWRRYVSGHYRRPAPYKDEVWLREQYVVRMRPVTHIARECGVTPSTVRKHVLKFGLPLWSHSELLRANGSVAG